MTARAPLWLGLAATATFALACAPKPLTPEEAKTKGDTLLRQMSQTAATVQTFSYTADETRDKVEAGGKKTQEHFTRRVVIRRPNALAFSDEGTAHDLSAWYSDGKITLVSNKSKVWARGPMPATLDEALDFVSSEYAIQIPGADLLYTSPYDALMTPDTTGGWVGVETIDGKPYDHVAYSQPLVDWELWLAQDDRHAPHRARFTYKKAEGQPTTQLDYRDFNPAPQVSDATFTPVIPDGYTRIKIMRHATVEDKTVAADTPSSDQKPK